MQWHAEWSDGKNGLHEHQPETSAATLVPRHCDRQTAARPQEGATDPHSHPPLQRIKTLEETQEKERNTRCDFPPR